jgi:hypothetical protein
MKLVKIGKYYFNPKYVVAVVSENGSVLIFTVGDPKPFSVTTYTLGEVLAILREVE